MAYVILCNGLSEVYECDRHTYIHADRRTTLQEHLLQQATNLKGGLNILLTIAISDAGCERIMVK